MNTRAFSSSNVSNGSLFSDVTGTELSSNPAMLQEFNPFKSSSESGLNYSIFEELVGLPTPSQKKITVNELFSNVEVLYYFLENDKEAFTYYLDLMEGKFKGRTIGEYPLYKVLILLSNYLVLRVEGLHLFLEKKIDTALQILKLKIISGQTSKSIEAVTRVSFSMVATLEPGYPSLKCFSMIDEPSSLRKLLYLWSLAAFFLSTQKKAKALERLRTVMVSSIS